MLTNMGVRISSDQERNSDYSTLIGCSCHGTFDVNLVVNLELLLNFNGSIGDSYVIFS